MESIGNKNLGWPEGILRKDIKIITSIPLSRNQMEDKNEWHFTNNEKCTVQSGYQVERVYPDKEKQPEFYGPTVDVLK